MKLLDWLLELLFPTRCAFCHKLRDGAAVCRWCETSIPRAQGEAQRQRFQHVELCVSPLYYEADVRQSLRRYKFHGAKAYWKIYNKFISKCVDGNEISCDIITWVPLSRRRLRYRGYDQARLLAEALAEQRGVPCARLLNKIRDNPAQSMTGGPEARRANVDGVYEAVNTELVQGKRVLLLDDIVTTGSTLSACAGVLKQAGAASVIAATVARARD